MRGELAITQGDAVASSEAPQGRRGLFLFKVVVSIALLAFIVSKAELEEIWQAIKGTNFLWVIAAASLNPIGGVFTALRWQGLLRSQGIDAPLYRLLQSCVAANFFRQFLPSTIGGDAIRAYDSWKLGATKAIAVSTLAVDRIFGLAVLLLFAMAAVLTSPHILPDFPLLWLWTVVVAAGLLGLLLLIFMPSSVVLRPMSRVIASLPRPAQRIATKFAGSLANFQGQPRLMMRSLALSAALQINVILFYIFIAKALDLPVPVLAFFIIVPIATMVMMLPISINAIGLREGVFLVLLGLFGVETAEAVAFAWLEFGLFLFYGVVGGLVYAFRR